MDLTIRTATLDDLPEIGRVDGRAFGYQQTPEDRDEFVATRFDPALFLLACADDGEIVGVAGAYDFDVTLPGGVAVPSRGVTWVAVSATHRRRGVLRALMAHQLRGYLADGVPLAVLTASESAIYRRFGYGEATIDRWVQIDRRFAEFRPDAPDPGGVRYIEADEARVLAPDVHRRWCARTPGAISRDERWWDGVFADRAPNRGGASALYFLAHPDGIALHRIRHGSANELRVDLFAATDEAHAALWRVLLGKDLVESVTARIPADDPLPLLLTSPRLVRTTSADDGMWAAVSDVAAVLSARRYATEIDVVLQVHDEFLDPDGRGGRFRLTGGPDGAACVRVDTAPDAALSLPDLGSLVFGRHSASVLARAGLLTVADPATLRGLDTAFAPERAAVHGTDF